MSKIGKIKSALICTFLFFSLITMAYADGKVSNVTMVPAQPNFGDAVTVSFDFCAANAQTELLMAISSFGGLMPSQSIGQVFVVSSSGINVPTVGPPSGTDFGYHMPAPIGAACTDCNATAGQTKHYSWVINVPDANMFPGCGITGLNLYITTKNDYLDGNTWKGLSGCALNQKIWTIGVPPKAFSIHKRVEGVVQDNGDLLLYSIDYTYGNGKLVITDPLPAGNVVQIVSVGPAVLASGVGVGASSGNVVWTLPDKTGLPGIANGTVWVLCKLNKPPAALNQVINNTATGSMGGTPPDQTSSAPITVGKITMSVTKSYDPPGGSVHSGDNITFYLDYQVNGSKLTSYESFDEMTAGNTYGSSSMFSTPPPGWEFLPFGANDGRWTVMNPCGTGDNYIRAEGLGAAQYPGMLINSGNPTNDQFCLGQIVCDAMIEGSWNGADAQVIIRNNGKAGAANYSLAVVLSQDSGPAYFTFQQICCGAGPTYPGTQLTTNTPGIQLNKWFRVRINVTKPNGTDYLYQAKIWARGDPEPTAYQISYTMVGGQTDANWRCDGLGNSTDWRPGVNEQGGDDGSNPIMDSYDNFVVYKPLLAGNAVLYDTVPAGMTYGGAPGSVPNSTNPMVLWNLGNISDQTGSYTWWGTTSGCNPVSNTAAMDGDDPIIPVLSNTVSINVICPDPVVSITKTASPTVAKQFDLITFTINYQNVGTRVCNPFVVTDPVPPQMSFISAMNGGTYAAGIVTWNINPGTGIAVGATGSVSWVGEIMSLPYLPMFNKEYLALLIDRYTFGDTRIGG